MVKVFLVCLLCLFSGVGVCGGRSSVRKFLDTCVRDGLVLHLIAIASMTGSSARLSRPFRMAVDVRGRLLVVDDARDRGSVRLIDGNLTPPASFVRKSIARANYSIF